MRQAIDISLKANRYGEPKIFSKMEADNFIENHSYSGMSYKYEIIKAK